MNVVTIPKEIPRKGELVLIARAEYEALRAQAEGREITPTKADIRALRAAEKRFLKGKFYTLTDVKRDMARRRRR